MNKSTAIAHTNIALIKYWGKKDELLRIPYTDSLSLTLDEFYTETTTELSDNDEDQFILDGKQSSAIESKRVFDFLNYFKNKYNINEYFKISSVNHVPNSAGLASSSSAFAALSASLNKVTNLNLDNKELSQLARVGSGSASRSIFGGFVQWHAGNNDMSSYAEQINDAKNSDISIISVIINKHKKNISSTKGMNLSRDTSPFYQLWPEIVQTDLKDIVTAISKNDLQKIGEISESNAMKMHALTLSSNPPFTYFEPETINIINTVQELRKEGFLIYFTIDAGPNVKIICSKKDILKLKKELTYRLNEPELVITKPGPGITYK
ncbi:diphosphomevalonate decarboxylase [Companilactobacillus sp. DQM5]|uniref:diphosphomevalonate decarboxylase n=1 Tax=Companilactobacillus sp. DQM5 TaxID=3463359 RepID=UPI00405900AE